MKTLIHTDGVKLTRRLEEAIEEKIGRVEQYAPRAVRARVQVRKVSVHAGQKQYSVQVLIELPGKDQSASERGPDPFVALDIVSDVIEKRLRRRKTKRLNQRNKRTPSIGDAF
ncbi:MAG: ribosome-associated translation inhibitor RaiA [Verrucomicrobia bacterium]|nr:ribosome-associated translation inhibitor RaiA [Verrucomicrobiota bacterium]